MVKRLTIDSSVIVSSLLRNETRHKEALSIWQSVLNGENFAIMPYSIFVEVVAAIRRRTGSEELALEVKNELANLENIAFVVLDNKATMRAAELAAKTGVRGMDAIVIQVAEEYGSELISFDEEMIKKAEKVLSK
ncbi:MAG: type II toxin-antitoxin system VapC family toxin [Candidatus Desantisbacteria bacterium]